MSSALQRLNSILYSNDLGNNVGLDEVRLHDPPILSRVPDLVELANSHELYIAHEACLVLVSWGCEVGLEYMSNLMDRVASGKNVIRPHRIWGHETALDEMAESLGHFESFSGNFELCVPMYRKLLGAYHRFEFDGLLQRSLRRSSATCMLPDVMTAWRDSLLTKGELRASMLIPVVVTWSPADAEPMWTLCENMLKWDSFYIKPMLEIAPLLSRVDALRRMGCLIDHHDQEVSDAARKICGLS